MFYNVIVLFIFAVPALSRHAIRYSDLDEDDKKLFRAAYDSPSYEPPAQSYDKPYEAPSYNQEYEEEDLSLGKIDLVKDGLWAIKAKITELKAFDKALAANLLSTKLKVKELLDKTMLKPKIIIEAEKKKPYYPAPSYEPHYEQHYAPQPTPYAQPHYNHDPYYGH